MPGGHHRQDGHRQIEHRHPGQSEETIPARVRFTREAAERARGECFAGLVEERAVAGRVEMDFLTFSLEWLGRWVLSFGGEAEAVAPVPEKPKPIPEVKKPPVREQPPPVVVPPPPVAPVVPVPKPPVPPEVRPKPLAEPKPPAVKKPPEPTKPKAPEPPLAKPKPFSRLTEFGNMDFPSLVDIYQVIGDEGVKILDKETAEYATTRCIYAQAFELEEAVAVDTVSLAMRKFGGDGTVYVDLVGDKDGRPELAGVRSRPVFLEKITRKPGYYWVDFAFPGDGGPPRLEKGRHWIVLRHSGEVIMNWFYVPGNPYGDSDDTRSTLKGYEWQDIQNYDFVFKVKGYK